MTELSKDLMVSVGSHANAYPKEGFSMVVDGKFKQHFATLADAQNSAMSLKTKFPMLQVAVRDAITGARSSVDLLD